MESTRTPVPADRILQARIVSIELMNVIHHLVQMELRVMTIICTTLVTVRTAIQESIVMLTLIGVRIRRVKTVQHAGNKVISTDAIVHQDGQVSFVMWKWCLVQMLL